MRILLALALLAAAPLSVPPANTPDVKDVSPVQMRKEAEESVSEMHGGMKKILGAIEKARAARDIVKLNCLNEKFTQMKALVRVAEQADVNLQEFLAKDQVEGATHERRKIALADEKVKGISGEADSCLGENGATGGKTTVHVDKPDFGGDPTHLDTGDGKDPLETPPSASPYN
jgi:hypothetical protein